MFPSTISVWLLMCPMALAAFSTSEYDVSLGCDLTFGNVLEALSTSRSITECSGQCIRNDRCLSVKYDSDKSLCQLNWERHPSLNNSCRVKMKFASLRKTSDRQLINDDCTLSAECSVGKSQCFLNTCQCKPGYSYKHSTESCVESCDVYGSTFTVYQGYGHLHYDTKELANIDNGDRCAQICAAESSFVCRSVDFWAQSRKCYLSEYTALVKIKNLFKSDSTTHYHRNCQLQ